MYHIKSDKRSRNSAAEIVHGLGVCLETMPLNAITVSDIHRATGISRATFYRLFDTPEDVLHYQFAQMVEATLEQGEGEWQDGPEKMMEATIELGMQNNIFLKAVVTNGRFDLLYPYTEQIFRMLDEKRAIFPADMEPAEREYLLGLMSMSMVGTLITWTRNGRKETPAETVAYLKRYAQVLWGLIGE